MDALGAATFPFANNGEVFVLRRFEVLLLFGGAFVFRLLITAAMGLVGSNTGALLESVDDEATILALDLVGDEATDLEEDPGVLLPLLPLVKFAPEKVEFFRELLRIRSPPADGVIELWKDDDRGLCN